MTDVIPKLSLKKELKKCISIQIKVI